MSVQKLEASLESGVQPVYVLIGDARPLIDRAASAIEAAVRPALGLPAFNHSTYRATQTDAIEALSTARTLPMMADRRLVVLHDLQEAGDELLSSLTDYVKDPAPETVLVVIGEGFPKVQKGGSNWGSRIRNAVKKHGGTLLKLQNKDASPVGFARELASARGKDLGKREAELLVALVGTDLGRLQQEVEKVVLYVGDAPNITGDDVTRACSMLAEAVIWDLTTGLATRDADVALTALHRLQESGDDARKLLGLVSWKLRDLLKAAELLRRGADDNQVRRMLRVRWDEFRRMKPMLQGDLPDAADVLRRLATANRQMNSHRAGADRLLEGVVLEMLEGRLRRPRPVPRAR